MRIYFNPRTHEEGDDTAKLDIKLQNDFNPRTHEECDIINLQSSTGGGKFQSTHSRGVRHFSCCWCYGCWCISIHALTRSATLALFFYHKLGDISIHALTRSAT